MATWNRSLRFGKPPSIGHWHPVPFPRAGSLFFRRSGPGRRLFSWGWNDDFFSDASKRCRPADAGAAADRGFGAGAVVLEDGFGADSIVDAVAVGRPGGGGQDADGAYLKNTPSRPAPLLPAPGHPAHTRQRPPARHSICILFPHFTFPTAATTSLL